MNKYTIVCPQCGRKQDISDGLFGNKVINETYICPMCSTVIDVAKAAAMSEERKKGLFSVIQYEGGNNVFIWKHPVHNFNKGTQLIVHESQEAIFFRDGKALDLFGAGRYTLDTDNLPLLQSLYSIPTNADTPFRCEVYFINKTVQMGIKWGTPDKVRFIDPLTGTPLEIGASGEMNLMVSDSRRLLLKLVGTTSGISWDDESDGFTKSLSKALRPLISSSVKVILPAVIKRNDIDLLEIDEKLNLISDELKNKLIPDFEEYGLTIPQLYVTSIALPEDDPNFKRIRELHTVTLQQRMLNAQANIKIAEAQNETLYRTEQEKSKAAIEAVHRDAEMQRQLTETEIAKREAERKIIEAQAETQTQRLQGLTEAEIMRAKGYNQKDVLQAEVQKAYAEGLAAAGHLSPQIGNLFGGFQQERPLSDSWQCSCGNTATGMFCNNCGNKGVVGNFCNNCGAIRPDASSAWNCSCGNTGIIGNFCNNCGKKRGD